MPTFADLPLSTRAAAAVNAIDAYPLTIPQRSELVALAVWPTDAALPDRVKRGSRVPDIDRRPTLPVRTARHYPRPPVVVTPAGGVDPARLRERMSRGDTIAAIAADLGIPWTTARNWIHGRA
jgi:hypothetical protein